jgi:ribosomal protein S21
MAVNFGIKRREFEDIDSLLRRFKKDTSKTGILREWKEKNEFMPRKAKRRAKDIRAVARWAADETKRGKNAKRSR